MPTNQKTEDGFFNLVLRIEDGLIQVINDIRAEFEDDPRGEIVCESLLVLRREMWLGIDSHLERGQ